MSGKVCLVTGGTSGVGRSIASGCARQGATVVLVARDPGRGERTAAAIRESTGNARVEWLCADLASLSSVRSLADTVRERFGALHVLSLNAAALFMERRTTGDGHESIFATNYLGHFLLSNLLVELLRASAPARVLTVSGLPASLTSVRLELDDLMLERGFSPLKATVRAALAKVLFSRELARRLSGSGVTSNTFHPGIVRSGLPGHLPWFLRIPVGIAMSVFPAESSTGIYLATSAEVRDISGAFFVGKRQVPFRPGYDVAEAAGSLWEASERLVGMR